MLRIYLRHYEDEKKKYDDLLRQSMELMNEWEGKTKAEQQDILEKTQSLGQERSRAMTAMNAYASLVADELLKEKYEGGRKSEETD